MPILSLRKLVSLSAINYALQSGQTLLLMPLAIAFLSPAESALWLYWGVISAFAYLCDLGLKPSLARAYVFAREQHPGRLDAQSLAVLSRKIYMALFAVTAGVASIFGVLTGNNLIQASANPNNALLATIIICLALAFNVACMGYKAKLVGLGRQDKDRTTEMAFNLARTIMVAATIVFTQSLLWIALSYLLSSLLLFFLSRQAANKIIAPLSELLSPQEQKAPIHELLVVTGKTSVLQFSAFAVYNAVAIYVAQNPDHQLVSNTLVTLRFFLIIQTLAMLPLSTLLPQIAAHWLKDQIQDVYEKLLALVALSLTLFTSFSIALYIFGSYFLPMLKEGAQLLGTSAFMLLFATYILEIHHVIHATIYMQKNQVPFMTAAILASALILVFGYFCHGNLLQLLLVQFSVQLLTNNWYPVYVTLKSLNKSIMEYLSGVMQQFMGFKFMSIFKLRIY